MNWNTWLLVHALEMHKVLGPGLLESVYQNCMVHELDLLEIPFEVDKKVLVKL